MIINPYAAATPISGPLDGYAADLWAAWAPYRLLGAFSGAYIRVRRASDNAEADCGSDAEIAAHCGASNGFVVTLYDQTGGGRHAAQGAASSQPLIYNGTSVIAEVGGKPSCQFDGANDFLAASPDGSGSLSVVDYFGAAKVNSDPANSVQNGPPLWTQSASGGSFYDHHTWVDGNIYTATFRTFRASGNPTDSLTLTHVLNNTSIASGNFTVRLNGQTLYDGSGGAFNGAAALDIGSSGMYYHLLGYVGAILIYSADKSTDRAAIRAAIA